MLNVDRIGKAGVKLERVSEGDLMKSTESYEIREGTVSSLRLDVVLSEIYNLSRSKVNPLIQSSKVKVNWRLTEEVSFPVEAGDYLSVRGFGRGKLMAIEGKTKKINGVFNMEFYNNLFPIEGMALRLSKLGR